MSIRNTFLTLSGLALVSACQAANPPLETVDYVDLERFMGDWYVLANIPTYPERGVQNPIEKYALNPNGTIETRFVYDDPKSGKRKTLEATAFVQQGTGNAIWGMQFIWPIKADYRIVYLDEDYGATIVGRNKRDYLWIMAREPSLPPGRLEALIEIAVDLGYDRSKIQISNWVTRLKEVS